MKLTYIYHPPAVKTVQGITYTLPHIFMAWGAGQAQSLLCISNHVKYRKISESLISGFF
jgi:hypothetical protein